MTQIQEQINMMCSMMCTVSGGLQRDAPPLSLGGEEAAAAPVPGYDVKEQSRVMASQLVGASKAVDALVRVLPDANIPEQEHLARIAALQEENEALGKELDEEMERAEKRVGELQEMFAMLADRKLKCEEHIAPP